MKNLMTRFVREEEGQDIIEYSLLAAFISISGYLILQSIGTQVNSIYTKRSDRDERGFQLDRHHRRAGRWPRSTALLKRTCPSHLIRPVVHAPKRPPRFAGSFRKKTRRT